MANITLCIITGSGINLKGALDLYFSEEPFSNLFPTFKCDVKGHEYKVIKGLIGNIPTILCSGRIHAYEGFKWEDFRKFLETFKELDVTHILSLNAVGSLNYKLRVPSFSLVEEITPIHYIKFPLNNNLKPNWQIVTNLPKVKYIWVTGPSYETKSELRLFRQLGGDVIGMSGAPELYWAIQLGYKIAMFSCITNYCFNDFPLTHDEVVRNASEATREFTPHLREIIINLSQI